MQLLFFFLLAAAYVAYVFFKPAEDIGKSKVDFETSVPAFLQSFESDQSAADAKYKGKVILLKGKVYKSENIGAAPLIYFDEKGNYTIIAGMQDTNIVLPNAGEEISIKGLYSGVINNDIMPGMPSDIKLEQCALVK